jgi:hypothetical protein
MLAQEIICQKIHNVGSKKFKKGGIKMGDEKMVKGFKNDVLEAIEPKFRDPRELSPEQLRDPDYALKQLEKLNGGKLSITCSKCHHCR